MNGLHRYSSGELDATLFPDDGFAAIASGAYEISWVGDVVTLSVDQNYDDLWEIVKLDMADDGKVLASYSYYPEAGLTGGMSRKKPLEMRKQNLDQLMLNRQMNILMKESCRLLTACWL